MKKVAKLVIIDQDDMHLMMYRSNHPRFGIDPDLPGGTLEGGETLLEAMLREVEEEAGVSLGAGLAREVYSGADYSANGTYYALYVAQVSSRPEITISWEHSSYEWMSRSDFLEKSKNANDTYMHMVYETLK